MAPNNTKKNGNGNGGVDVDMDWTPVVSTLESRLNGEIMAVVEPVLVSHGRFGRLRVRPLEDDGVDVHENNKQSVRYRSKVEIPVVVVKSGLDWIELRVKTCPHLFSSLEKAKEEAREMVLRILKHRTPVRFNGNGSNGQQTPDAAAKSQEDAVPKE